MLELCLAILELLFALLDDDRAGFHGVLLIGGLELEVRTPLEKCFLGGSYG